MIQPDVVPGAVIVVANMMLWDYGCHHTEYFEKPTRALVIARLATKALYTQAVLDDSETLILITRGRLYEMRTERLSTVSCLAVIS